MTKCDANMHHDQIDIYANISHSMIREQFPQYRDLPVAPLATIGTMNAIFRKANLIAMGKCHSGKGGAGVALLRTAP